MEMQRQRLKALKKELRVLRLHKKRLGTITVADVRAARAARAKSIHPDVVLSAAERLTTTQEADSDADVDEPAPRGFFGTVFGFLSPKPKPAASEEDKDEEAGPSREDAMIELNAAYDRVFKAITSA